MGSALNISLKIAEHWQLAHNFLGDEYESRVSPFRDMLRDSTDKGIPLMTAALALSKAAQETGNSIAIIYTSAAVYDLIAEQVSTNQEPADER